MAETFKGKKLIFSATIDGEYTPGTKNVKSISNWSDMSLKYEDDNVANPASPGDGAKPAAPAAAKPAAPAAAKPAAPAGDGDGAADAPAPAPATADAPAPAPAAAAAGDGDGAADAPAPAAKSSDGDNHAKSSNLGGRRNSKSHRQLKNKRKTKRYQYR